jgi:hypothetical protein
VQTAAFTHHLARALRERTAPALQIDLLGYRYAEHDEGEWIGGRCEPERRAVISRSS